MNLEMVIVEPAVNGSNCPVELKLLQWLDLLEHNLSEGYDGVRLIEPVSAAGLPQEPL